MKSTNYLLGILAYGSLIDDPGKELEPFIIDRISCETPFKVEFARLSSTRDNAPTIVPSKDGLQVSAIILVLDHTRITYAMAQSMLWRREIRSSDTRKIYKNEAKAGPNKVSVLEIKDFNGVETVLFTSIDGNMGVMNTPPNLAHFAILSILNKAGETRKDGIHYLLDAKNNGIKTNLSDKYELEILRQTGTKSLEEAIIKLDALRPANLAFLAENEKFEEQVLEIADFIGNYGIIRTLGDIVDDDKLDIANVLKEKQKEFITNCHSGFKEAQKRILKLMIDFEADRLELKSDLKNARRERAKVEANGIVNRIEHIEHREKILRHLMDSIAWNMIKGQLYIARRLYQEVEGEKVLKHSNLDSLLYVSDQINATDTDFALITDLTSYIQTGDLLCSIDGKLVLSEVKEGNRNHEILEILDVVQTNSIPLETVEERFNLDKKSFQQLKRQAKQMETMSNFMNIVNTDKGIESSSGREITIITPKEPTHLYTDRLQALREQLKTRNLWAYDIIDDCLHIGIYKGHFRHVGPKILKAIGETKTSNIVIVNYLRVIESLNQPLLFLPFDKEFIFDILFGRVAMYFMIDLDKFMELYPDYGLTATLATRKETMKARELIKMKGMFMHQNRGIKVTNERSKKEIWLADGTFLKMVFDSVYPAYIAYSANYSFPEVVENN